MFRNRRPLRNTKGATGTDYTVQHHLKKQWHTRSRSVLTGLRQSPSDRVLCSCLRYTTGCKLVHQLPELSNKHLLRPATASLKLLTSPHETTGSCNGASSSFSKPDIPLQVQPHNTHARLACPTRQRREATHELCRLRGKQKTRFTPPFDS